ncbi:MAG: hypothetical protein HW414_617 [Dehalococcoidia bacterium]|nr:hypothetical protein [Dehalococcoidia bacterium]
MGSHGAVHLHRPAGEDLAGPGQETGQVVGSQALLPFRPILGHGHQFDPFRRWEVDVKGGGGPGSNYERQLMSLSQGPLDEKGQWCYPHAARDQQQSLFPLLQAEAVPQGAQQVQSAMPLAGEPAGAFAYHGEQEGEPGRI